MIEKIIKKIFFLIKNRRNIESKNVSSEDYQKLAENFKKYEQVKIHIGCGPRVLKGWINIDLAFEPYENYLKYYGDEYYSSSVRGDKNDFYAIDVTKTGLPLPDKSVDTIFHEDFIEHLNQKEQIIFLSEAYRILKDGGVHRINTPDLISSMEQHSNFKQGKQGVYNNEWNLHGHKNVLTKKYLEEIALMIGYTKIIFNNKNQSTSNSIPKEYRPDPSDRPLNGNIFADLIK